MKRVSLGLLLVFSFLAVASLHGCRTEIPVSVGSFSFNPAIRKDRQNAVTEPERLGTHSVSYSSGKSDGTQARVPPVSELYPVPTGFRLSDPMALERFLRKFRRSKCYWASPHDSLRLSWEVIAHGVSGLAENCNTNEIGACWIAHPITLQRLECGGLPATVPALGPRLRTTTVLLKQCRRANRSNPYNECQTFEEDCAFVEGMCVPDSNSPTHYHFPFCQLDCLAPASTGTYRLSIFGIPNPPEKAITPTVNLVTETVLSRELRGREDGPEPGTWQFSWAVKSINGADFDGTTENQAWEENFSPDIFIGRVRVFREDMSVPGGKRYLRVRRLRFSQAITACDAAPGELEFNAGSCLSLPDTNPAYLKGDEAKRLLWMVSIPTEGQDGGAPLSPDDKLFIEFTIRSPAAAGGQALRLSLTAADLGPVPNSESLHPHMLRVINTDRLPRRLERVEFEYYNLQTDGRFAIESGTGQRPPFDIRGGADLPLTIIARPTGDDELSARARFIFSHGREIQRLVVPITARVHAAQMYVSPATLGFTNVNPAHQEKIVVIINAGHVPLIIQALEITGLNQYSFTFVGATSSFPFNIPVGGSHVVRLRFEPAPRLFVPYADIPEQAALRIRSNAGERTVGLLARADLSNVRPADGGRERR